MTPPNPPWTDADAALLDRLVDGELDGPTRRALLERLDAEPGGWKRCALAFLEAQCWREALATPLAAPVSITPPIPVPAPRTRTLRLAAAAVVAAFAIGWGAGSRRPEAPTAVVDRGPGPEAPVVSDSRPEAGEEAGTIRTVGVLRLGPGGVGVPVVAGPGLDEGWLLEQGPEVPEYVRARWERRGYRLDGRREVYEVRLPEGGRVALPVDQVRATFVGLPPA